MHDNGDHTSAGAHESVVIIANIMCDGSALIPLSADINQKGDRCEIEPLRQEVWISWVLSLTSPEAKRHMEVLLEGYASVMEVIEQCEALK